MENLHRGRRPRPPVRLTNATPSPHRARSRATPRAPTRDHPSTPQFFSALLSHRISDDFDFRFQLNTAVRERSTSDLRNQFEHLRRGRAAIVHNEVAMDLRHPSISDAGVLQTEFLDQFSGGCAVGIFENTAGAFRDGLSCAPLLLRFL